MLSILNKPDQKGSQSWFRDEREREGVMVNIRPFLLRPMLTSMDICKVQADSSRLCIRRG